MLKPLTKGQKDLYRDLRNGYYIVWASPDYQLWLMKDRSKVRAINSRLIMEDLDFGLLDKVKVGSTVIYTAKDRFTAESFFRGNIAQLNCKEIADRNLKFLLKVNAEMEIFDAEI